MLKEIAGTISFPAGHLLRYSLSNVYKEPHSFAGFSFTPPLPSSCMVMDMRVGNNTQFACAGWFNAELLSHLEHHKLNFDKAQPAMDFTVDLQIPPPVISPPYENAPAANYVGRAVFTLDPDVHAPPHAFHRTCLVPFNERSMFALQVMGKLEKFLITGKLLSLLKEEAITITFHQSMQTQPHQDINYGDVVKHEIVENSDGKTPPYLFFPDAPRLKIAEGLALKIEYAEGKKAEFDLDMLQPQNHLVGLLEAH